MSQMILVLDFVGVGHKYVQIKFHCLLQPIGVYFCYPLLSCLFVSSLVWFESFVPYFDFLLNSVCSVQALLVF